MTRGDGNTLRALWLHLLKQGGWWTASELRDHFQRVQAVTPIVRNMVAPSLLYGAGQGYFKRRAGEGPKSAQYAVTGDCLIPSQIRCGEVQL